ncbi:MAG: ABC transporter permease [Bacteroidales bacterium]|nr:ABC transporter permease [Candidatus Colimorpha merdihippi]
MFCFIIPALLVSGFVSPVENMPSLLQYIATVDPLYYLFTATRGIFLKAYSFQDILSPHIIAFAIIGATNLVLAYTMLRLKKD